MQELKLVGTIKLVGLGGTLKLSSDKSVSTKQNRIR